MKKASKQKVAAAGLRVLELYKYMSNHTCTQQEIIRLIEENENVGNIYAKETISKYLNTLKVVGFNIEKTGGKFYLKNNIDSINLNINEIRAFNFLKSYTKNLVQPEIQSSLYEQFEKIENALDKNTYELLKSQEARGIHLKNLYDEQLKKLIKEYTLFCTDKQLLVISYQEKTYKVHPQKVMIKNNNAYLVAYYPPEGDFKEFLLDKITEVKQLPNRFPDKSIINDVTFTLKGHLAKVYVSRDEEKIDVNEPSTLTVTNHGQDREVLMKRLLRYRENCEIKFPREFRADFKNLLDRMIANYE